MDWVYTDFENYSEKGNSGLELTFYDDDMTSLQTTLIVQGSTDISIKTRKGMVMSLQGSLAWKHEFDKDQRDVEVSFVDDTRAKRFTYQTEKPDRDFFERTFRTLWITIFSILFGKIYNI